MTTADNLPYTPGMPLYTLAGEPVVPSPEAPPSPHGDTLWIEWGDDEGCVLSILYGSPEAARAARESSTNQCFVCGRLLSAPLPRASGKAISAIDDGLIFRATGNYGSSIFDPGDDQFIEIVICDACAVARQERSRHWAANPDEGEWSGPPYSLREDIPLYRESEDIDQ